MHELSVCQALLNQVVDIVQAQGAALVERITIDVGPLSGTEPGLLCNAFLAMRAGPVAQAMLVIERGPVSVRCLGCGADSQVSPNRLRCARCGGWRTRVTAGDELRLLRVEMRAA